MVRPIELFFLVSISAYGMNMNYLGSTLWNNVIDIKVAGNFAYCAMVNGLAVVDISDPANPLMSAAEITAYAPNAIELSGNYAFLATPL